jgi:hypothetical protein
MTVRNIGRYLAAVVEEYRKACRHGFVNEYEGKKALWHAAIVIYRTADDPEPYLDKLRDIALDTGLRPTRIETTIHSAERQAR